MRLSAFIKHGWEIPEVLNEARDAWRTWRAGGWVLMATCPTRCFPSREDATPWSFSRSSVVGMWAWTLAPSTARCFGTSAFRYQWGNRRWRIWCTAQSCCWGPKRGTKLLLLGVCSEGLEGPWGFTWRHLGLRLRRTCRVPRPWRRWRLPLGKWPRRPGRPRRPRRRKWGKKLRSRWHHFHCFLLIALGAWEYRRGLFVRWTLLPSGSEPWVTPWLAKVLGLPWSEWHLNRWRDSEVMKKIRSVWLWGPMLVLWLESDAEWLD